MSPTGSFLCPGCDPSQGGADKLTSEDEGAVPLAKAKGSGKGKALPKAKPAAKTTQRAPAAPTAVKKEAIDQPIPAGSDDEESSFSIVLETGEERRTEEYAMSGDDLMESEECDESAEEIPEEEGSIPVRRSARSFAKVSKQDEPHAGENPREFDPDF